MDLLDLIGIYRAFHPKNNGFHLFLKCTQSILQDTSHPGPQIWPCEIKKKKKKTKKKPEIILIIFSDQDTARLYVN